MRTFIVITAIGSDRVGIADDISQEVLRWNCNIEEGKMSVLGGEFAAILLISGQEGKADELLADLESFGQAIGLQVEGRKTFEQKVPSDARPYVIRSVSLDTPGIVKAITGVVREEGISIEEAETSTRGAPFSGAPMFHMELRVLIPAGVSVKALRHTLDQLADERDLDVSVESLGA